MFNMYRNPTAALRPPPLCPTPPPPPPRSLFFLLFGFILTKFNTKPPEKTCSISMPKVLGA